MSDIRQARKALARRILEGAGKASPSERRAAFNNSGLAEPLGALVDKVARHAYRVTDEDIIAARVSGLSEDQVFEIVVCAAIGQATRQYDTAIAALDATTASHASVKDIAERFNAASADELGRSMTNRWVGGFVRRLGLATMKTGGVYVVPATELPKARVLAARFGVNEAA